MSSPLWKKNIDSIKQRNNGTTDRIYIILVCVCVYSGVQHVWTIWVAWWVSYTKYELLTLREHLGVPPYFGWDRVSHLFSFPCTQYFQCLWVVHYWLPSSVFFENFFLHKWGHLRTGSIYMLWKWKGSLTRTIQWMRILYISLQPLTWIRVPIPISSAKISDTYPWP